MKRLCVFLACLVLVGINLVQAQTVRITGTVTSSEDGMPIPGVSVVVKGTTTGGITNIDGKYELNVPAGSQTLMFSFVGMKTQEVEIGGRTVVDVVLEPESVQVEEVVVTALGITRQKKALGYAVQDVQGDELAKVRTSNVIGALSGRVAGVQITTATGQMGGGSRIQVRGSTSLTGNNQPLYVVDGIPLDNSDYSSGATGGGGYDMGNSGGDINPDDIESISILKGASATALYGSRAANGVVMVTTKKAKLQGKKAIGVAVNSSVTFEQAAIYPEYQKLYGGGSGDFFSFDQGGHTYLYPDFSTDESWGNAYDKNTMVLMWNSFDEWDTEHYMVERPWVYPKNDYTTFFRTGVSYQNNIQINGGNENGAFRLSYTNNNTDGIYPNSSMKRNTVSFSGTGKFSKKLDSWINVNYLINEATGRPATGYDDKNPVQKMWQWIHTSIDYKELKAYKNPDGSQRTWNRIDWNNPTPMYTDNPYWSMYENYQNDRRDRVYGNFGLNYQILPWIKWTGRMGVDYYEQRMFQRSAVGSQAQSFYSEDLRTVNERTLETFFTVDKRVAEDKIGVSAILGANQYDRKYWRNGGYTDGGLVIPKLYALSNSSNLAIGYDYNSWKRINSLYGNFTFDYNRMVFAEFSVRNDHSSTLPKDNRSYMYYSANLSFIASELEFLKSMSFLSFAKIRAGYAKVGNDTDPYSIADYYNSNTPFGSDTRLNLPTSMANKNLKPEETSSWEVGGEFKFLMNRLSLEVSYYNKVTKNQIIPIQVSASTGFASFYTNSGQMTNTGLEISVGGTPLKIGDFQWDINLNVATLTNTVDEISKKYGLTYLSLGGAPFKVQIGAFEGQTYPIIYGTDYVKDDKGNKMVSPVNGRILASGIKPLGQVNPKMTGGITNSFTYKGFDMSILIDMQKGGHIYYLSNTWGMYSGILKESARKNEFGVNIREPITADETSGGWLYDAVYGRLNADGTTSYLDATGAVVSEPVKNTRRVSGGRYCWDYYSRADAQSVFKTDFYKLREVRLGYTIPEKYTGPIKGLRVSVFGRNLACWGQENKHFDPEYLQMAGSNAQGSEGGYLPSTRTFGFGLNFNF